MRILTIVAILGLFAVVLARPSKKEEEYIEVVDDSDKELIRVARGDIDEDQEPEEKSQTGPKRSTEGLDKRSRRAAEEDAFFQALLTRASDERNEKRRSFDDGADNTGYIIRDDWKGDSKISDADRQELENLFNAITSPDDDGEEKIEETRSLKPGMDGKVQQFIDWLMSQPPDKFTKSLSHILDVEATLTKMFYDGKNLQQQQQQQQPQQGQQQQQDVPADSSKTSPPSSKNCKTKCYTLQLGNTECKIICEPPQIEQPTPSPAYGFYPQQAGYGQQYPSYTGQTQALPCVPPNCPPSQMYPPAPQYTGQGYSAPPSYPAPSQLIQPGIQSPVQEGCVGRSCDAKNLSQSDKPAEDKPVKQDKPAEAPVAAPASSKPAPAAAPVTFQTQGAQITVDPVQVSTEAPPQIPMNPMVPSQFPMPLPQPYVIPPQIPSYESYAPVPGIQQPPAAAPVPYYKPMPKNCEDYDVPRCRVFLDWPTDERNEIRASLRFKQNWDSDFQTPSSTKYRILKSEVEKAIKDVYSQVPSYSDVKVTGFSQEDLKVTVNFIISFNQPENGALHYLSQAISNNYLQSMPIYKNTLLREGLKHHHRPIVATQKELEALPKVKVESSHKHDDDVLTTESEAYQGCFRDRKPHRDLPKQYTKYEMTPDWCVARCKLAGYLFAGVQYGYLCFCGNHFGKYGKSDDAECNSLCFGDKTRTCGAFWHNSIFSIDGKKHIMDDFSKADDKEQSGSAETQDGQEPDVPDHTVVANNLMKAAEAALKAAKKLLPETRHGKSKRTPDEELQFQQETAIKALNDAELLMSSNSAAAAAGHKHKKKEKREAEGDGRDLLVAYLSDVGGYDRNYRDVEDEDESGSSESKSKKEKFEYRRMVIDESGDGEFVERSKNKELLARRRREVSPEPWDENFDGPKKMASRAAPVEAVVKRHVVPVHLGDTEDDPSRLGAASGEVDIFEQSDKTGESEESGEGWESEQSGDSDDGGEADSGEEPNQSGFAEESGESGESRQSDEVQESGDETERVKSDETGFARDARVVKPEVNHDTQTRYRRELREEIKELQRTNPRLKRESALLDENKLKTIKEHVEQGTENILSLIVDIYQSRNSLQKLQQFVQQLKQDVMQRMNLPEEQRQQALNHLRETVKQTVVKKVNELSQSIRQEVQDYKQNHQAVSQQAKEAATAILDIPVFQDKVENLKSNIKKRAVDIEQEYKKAKRGTEELPSILKEHFKRNAPDLKEEIPERLSRLHRDLNL